MPIPTALRRPRARRVIARRSWSLLAAGVAAGLASLTTGTAATAAEMAFASTVGVPVTPVIVVGFSGVQWSDVTGRTPALASFASEGAIGDVTVRSVRASACPVDGWLALSAGRRAGDSDDSADHPDGAATCRPIEVASNAPFGPATVNTWGRYRQAAANAKFDATPGLLGQALQSVGTCATAVGPGAAVALARPDGRVARYTPSLDAGPGALGASPCPLTVVDAGSVTDRRYLPASSPVDPAEAAAERAAQVRAVDAVVGRVLRAAPSDARVLVVSLADSGRTPHLQLIGVRGPGFGPGWLRTSSTRQDALVQATDLAPTVANLLAVPAPVAWVGSPLTALTVAAGQAPAKLADRLRKLADLEQAAQEVQRMVSPFFTGLVVAQLLLYGAAAAVLRHRWTSGSRRRRVLTLVRRVALVFACFPIATYLANTLPWWRSSHPLAVLVLCVIGYVAVLTAISQLGPWRRSLLGPFGAVAGLTAAVLAADVLTGSRLQTSSLMGLQPVVAGRFYGLGNVAFALFATGALLLAIAGADRLIRQGRRRIAAALVASLGVLATVLDVSPAWGSDFGGPIGMVPAFAVLTLLVLGIRLSWRKGALIAAGTVLLLTLVSVADWSRPVDQQTHLGRFVQTVVDGGAWQVISRKGQQNLSILFGSWLTVLVPVGALFLALILLRPSSWGAGSLARAYDRSPTLRQGMGCLMLLLGIGFATNDSGTTIPAVGATVAIPLLIAVSLRALADDELRGPPTSPATANPATEPPVGGSPPSTPASEGSSPALDPGRTPPRN